MSAGVSLCSGISCTLVLLSPGIGDRPKCDRGLVPCPLVGSASTVGWSGRAEVLRRRRSCRQHSRPHQPDSIDITALRHNLSLRLQLLSHHLYVSCAVFLCQETFHPTPSQTSSDSVEETPAYERKCVVCVVYCYCRQLSPFIPSPTLPHSRKTVHTGDMSSDMSVLRQKMKTLELVLCNFPSWPL